MNREKIENVVVKMIKNLVPPALKNKINLNMTLREDLGLDSIRMLSLVSLLDTNANFDSMLASTEVDFTEILTCVDVVNVIEKYQKS